MNIDLLISKAQELAKPIRDNTSKTETHCPVCGRENTSLHRSNCALAFIENADPVDYLGEER